MLRLSLLLLVVLGILHSCSGAAYFLFVDAVDGVDNSTCITSPTGDTDTIHPNASCLTLAYALTPLTVRDNLRQLTIYPGTYQGSGNVNLSPLVGAQLWTGFNSGGVRPVIDCGNQASALTLREGTTTSTHVFENIEFRNCVGTTGGAVNIPQRVPSTTFTNCVFTNNHATQNGGAIQGTGTARLTINRCIFRNNSAVSRGGAISVTSQTLRVSNSVFDSNSAETGGAIYGSDLGNVDSVLFFENSNFTNNVASSSNGGAFFGESTGARNYTFGGSIIDNNCGNTVYTDSYDVQVRCAASSDSCHIVNRGTVSGCEGTYVPPATSSSEDEGVSNRDRAIIIGVVVPFTIIAVAAIALFFYLRKGHKKEMGKRDEYRKKILKALDNMPPEEQEAARLEAENAGPKAPKCQLCQERPIVTPLPCGHEIVCAICRTILLECPVKNCKAPTR